MERNRSALVVGGGPAGLLAAIHLARAGLSVTVLEARGRLGGRAGSDPYAGRELNQGPHALYAGGAARRELAAVGVDPPSWRPRLLGVTVLRGGRPRRVAAGPRATAELLSFALRRGAWRRDDLADTPAADWLEAEVRDPEARAVVAALTRVGTYAADLQVLSADVAAAQLRMEAWPGVRYLGSWQGLVEALATAARGAGARIETGAAARAVARVDGGWRATTDAGDRHADLVLLAAGGPERAAKLLDRPLPIPGPPAEVSALDLLLHRLPRPSRTFAAGIDSPHYLSIHSRPGTSPVHVSLAAYLTPQDGTSGTRPALEAVADAVQPGWRSQLVAEPRHLARMKAVTALPAAATGGLAGRPGPAAAQADGLALAGDWVGGEGHLLDAALASARAAADALLASDPVPAARRTPGPWARAAAA